MPGRPALRDHQGGTTATEPREAFGLRRIPALSLRANAEPLHSAGIRRTPHAPRLSLPVRLFIAKAFRF